jgi:hypothetical protein
LCSIKTNIRKELGLTRKTKKKEKEIGGPITILKITPDNKVVFLQNILQKGMPKFFGHGR